MLYFNVTADFADTYICSIKMKCFNKIIIKCIKIHILSSTDCKDIIDQLNFHSRHSNQPINRRSARAIRNSSQNWNSIYFLQIYFQLQHYKYRYRYLNQQKQCVMRYRQQVRVQVGGYLFCLCISSSLTLYSFLIDTT